MQTKKLNCLGILKNRAINANTTTIYPTGKINKQDKLAKTTNWKNKEKVLKLHTEAKKLTKN